MAKVVESRVGSPDMDQKVKPCVRPMERFALRSLPVHDYERSYIDTFLSDDSRWPEPVYRVLNEVFLDAYAINPYPDGRDELDIDEAELRVRVERSLEALRRTI